MKEAQQLRHIADELPAMKAHALRAAAARIEALEAALRQAREALRSAADTAKFEGHSFRPWRHAAADSVADINDLLKD
jgi:hypothetical protein